MQKFFGVSASPGRVAGHIYRLRHTHAGLGRSVGAPQSELESYEAAVQQACDELEALGDAADAQDRDIFMAQRMMLQDEGLAEETRAYIRVGAGAAAAVERAAGVYADKLRSIGDDPQRSVVMVTHDLRAALRSARTVLHIGRSSYFLGTVKDYLASPQGRRFREVEE